MNILVTGASGFIGRRVSSRLKAKGHQVTSLSFDLTKPFSLSDSFDFVIHLAAYNITNVGSKNEDLYMAVNVEGTRHLLKAVHAKKFIYMSTVKVYKNEGMGLTEDSPVGPQGAYEQSKLNAEEMCRTLLKKESLVILRSVNVIGWGQAPKAVLPVFFQKAKAGQPLDIIGSPQALMQFVYVEDLIDAIEAIITHDEAAGIFNIAHEDPISLEQLARAIIALTHSSSVLNVINTGSGTLFSPVICHKVYQQLGWKAKTGLMKILEHYYRHLS